ncbi:MAG: hypothetical protein H0V74_04720 [Chloroflexi bacterium]|nr:hypothetical protein [Chloroflexota bacterium]
MAGDGERPSVERRDRAHAETLGGRDEERLGEPWAVFGAFDEELGCPDEIGIRR